jgi:hypothetical protein
VRRLARWPLHPFLLAAYPALFLYSRNLDEADPVEVFRLLAIALIGTAMVFLVLRRLFRGGSTAPLLTSLFVLFFFGYGIAMAPLWGRTFAGYVYGRGMILLPAWCVLFSAGATLVVRSPRIHPALTQFLNFFSIAALALTTSQGLNNLFLNHNQQTARQWSQIVRNEALTYHSKHNHPTSERRDIYLIVADTYTRSDILSSDFHYDNTWFERELQRLGFIIAHKSYSNYTFTYASLSATLNLNYLSRFQRLMKTPFVSERLMKLMI